MWKKIVVAALVIIPVALFAAAWYFSSQIVSPKVKPCPVDHFIYCKGPSELNLRYEDVTFRTKDGLTLRGWFMPAENLTGRCSSSTAMAPRNMRVCDG
jgi:uncharacterized protein